MINIVVYLTELFVSNKSINNIDYKTKYSNDCKALNNNKCNTAFNNYLNNNKVFYSCFSKEDIKRSIEITSSKEIKKILKKYYNKCYPRCINICSIF